MISKLKKELDEFKDKLDEMEVDRNKARNSQRIVEWKMRRAIATVEGREFVEAVPVNIENKGLTRRESTTEENYNRINKNI